MPLGACGTWRTRVTSANGQPAVALYLNGPAVARGPDDGSFRAWSITVLTLRGERIADLTSFLGAEHFAAARLPLVLD